MRRSDDAHLSGAFISLLGVLAIIAHVPPLARVETTPALVLTIVLPGALGVVLIGVGYMTAKERVVDAADAFRLSGWVLVGMVVFLFVGVWIIVLELLLAQPVPFGYILTVNAVTLGGVAGSVIGLYDAQSRAYTRRLERRETELEQQNQRLDDIVSIVSHDLRNPLNVAEGRLTLAQEDSTSEHLDHVARALERMETLIDDLLKLARQDESVTTTEPVDIAELVDDCWQHVENEDTELVVETQLVINADRNRLQQLLENLLRNAVEHGGDDGTITIGDIDDASGFYVADDGPGIPEEEREDVFEFGYSTQNDGTGLGLVIVKRVVDAHGWEIHVSDSDTGGARFDITGVETASQ